MIGVASVDAILWTYGDDTEEMAAELRAENSQLGHSAALIQELERDPTTRCRAASGFRPMQYVISRPRLRKYVAQFSASPASLRSPVRISTASISCAVKWRRSQSAIWWIFLAGGASRYR